MSNETRILKSRIYPYDEIFRDCILSGREYYDGEIVNRRIVITDNLPYPCSFVRAVRLDLIDVIETPTDLSDYGFIKINSNNRWTRQKS